MAYQPNQEEGLDTKRWLINHGLQNMIELFQQNGLTLEILMFAQETELKQLCEDTWNLDNITKIKFLSAMRKQSTTVITKAVILGEEERQILDNLVNKKAKIKTAITQYQQTQNQLQHDVTYINKQIDSSCDSMIAMIEKYRKELLNDIDTKYKQRSINITNTLDELNRAFEIIQRGHKECQDIARNDEISMDSKLCQMNEIATKHKVKSLEIDTTAMNQRLTLKYDHNGFKKSLPSNIVVKFEVDEKSNEETYIDIEEEYKIKEHEVLRFSTNFRSQNGIILTENNKYCQSYTKSGGDVWILVDMVPVTMGKHCWRVHTINPLKRYIMFGVSEMKMYEKRRSNDTIYGIGNNNKYWPFTADICKRDRVKLSKFMNDEFEIDIFLDRNAKMLKLCVVGNNDIDNNAWIMIDDKLDNIGLVPHIELEGCINGPKIRISKIPIEWFGKSKKITLLG